MSLEQTRRINTCPKGETRQKSWHGSMVIMTSNDVNATQLKRFSVDLLHAFAKFVRHYVTDRLLRNKNAIFTPLRAIP